MAYADYEFYAGSYSGSMSEIDFVKYSDKAQNYIDIVTRGRAKTAPDAMKIRLALAFCSVIDTFKAEDDHTAETKSGLIKSESIGDMSVTYGTAEGLKKAYEANRKIICNDYLTMPVNLMLGWI